MSRITDRTLDLRLRHAVVLLSADGMPPRFASAVKEARARLFPLHCASCGEIPHDGQRCRRPSERKEST